MLNPGGRTWHSITPAGEVPRKHRATFTVHDAPLGAQPMDRLRRLTGERGRRAARVFNLDEDGMISSEDIAWIDARLGQACLSSLPPSARQLTSFGGVPAANLCGDHGQLPASEGGGAHLEPGSSRGPIAQRGWQLRRQGFDVIVLDETMRQGPDQAALLARLLAIRRGEATRERWRHTEHGACPQDRPALFEYHRRRRSTGSSACRASDTGCQQPSGRPPRASARSLAPSWARWARPPC